MAVLGQKKIETLKLPYSDAQVKLRTRLTTAEMKSLYEDRSDELGALVKILAGVIVEWDFTEEDGTPIAVTPEAINRIDGEDFMVLTDSIRKFAENLEKHQVGADEKKS